MPLLGMMDSYRLYKLGDSDLMSVLKAFIRIFYSTDYARMTGREKGYVLFQDFIPDNDHDIRLVVIGSRAFGAKRMVRPGDFRASGSHVVVFGREHISDAAVALAFKLSNQLQTQIAVFDFVTRGDEVVVLEVSFGTSIDYYFEIPGYWDEKLNWIEEKIDPGGWMVEELIKNIPA